MSPQITERSTGLTASEAYLAALCKRSFLSLWSYSNVFRDQKKNGYGDGKEICDVLIVFDKHVILFSDKSCAYPNTGDERLDWRRWFQRAISKSADQVYGAERWLRKYPDRVYLDKSCGRRFPIKFPPASEAKYHRVVVALNAAARCKSFFGNSGSGSLVINPGYVGQALSEQPFHIGQIQPDKGYVHVFDDVTLDIVLQELDTITDFTDYLTRKEQLIISGKLGSAAGEEELLAHYVTHLNSAGQHDFVIPENIDLAIFDEGSWQSISTDPQYVAKKNADLQSYAWDRLIEVFNRHIAGGTLEHGSELSFDQLERGVKIMTSEPRLARRNLAKALLDIMGNARPERDSVRHLLSDQHPDRGYIFLISGRRRNQSYDDYRRNRTALLSAYCHVAKLNTPSLLDIVGLGLDTPGSNGGSEDLIYLDARSWSEEDTARARELQEVTGILRSPRETHFHEEEYPVEAHRIIPSTSQSSVATGNRKQRRAAKAEERRNKRRLR
jgi:hypothetical protein